jgi:hypothetical protein
MTPLDEHAFRLGKQAAENGEPWAKPSSSFSQSMADAFQAGYDSVYGTESATISPRGLDPDQFEMELPS